jgi:hypothetical protein
VKPNCIYFIFIFLQRLPTKTFNQHKETMSRKSKWDVPDTKAETNGHSISTASSRTHLHSKEDARHPLPGGKGSSSTITVPGTSLVTVHDSVTGLQQTTIVKEIEINDCKNRHILTKGATLAEVRFFHKYTKICSD